MLINFDNTLHYTGKRNYFNYSLQDKDTIINDWYPGHEFYNQQIMIKSIDWLGNLSNRWCILLFEYDEYHGDMKHILYFENKSDVIRYKLTWL